MKLFLIYSSIVIISIIITIYLLAFNTSFSTKVIIQNYLLAIKIKIFENLIDNIINLVKEDRTYFVYTSYSISSLSSININNNEEKEYLQIMNYSDGNENTTTIYENPVHNLLMFYPKDWKIIGDESNISFLPSLSDKSQEIKLIINISHSGNVPLKEYASIQIINLKQNKTDFKILDSGISSIDSNQAYKLTYSYSDNEKTFEIYQIWTIFGEKLYSIAFQATTGNFDLYFPTIQKILNFIEIQGIASETNHESSKVRVPGINVTRDPNEILYNPISKKLFVTNFKFHTVSVIDEYTDRLIKEIKVGMFPIALNVNPDLNTYIYI